MPNLRISSFEGRPLLDVRSYARHGPGHRARLSPEEIAHIDRTVRRVPEVMVKVLSKDSNNLRSVARHLNYIGRRGALELETDDGGRVQGRNAGHQLVEDWDLDLDRDRRQLQLTANTGRAPKLVHKVILSMPPGTPAKGVLEAARYFAREEFALKHRYALVLHTDDAHPHVHLVLKAVSEQGKRLSVGKSTLREWRSQFARHLREQGIEANATERAVRGETRMRKPDVIYRATLRGESTHTRARAESVASEVLTGKLQFEAGKPKLLETRREIERGWRAIRNVLLAQDQPELAAEIHRFLNRMRPPRTERESIAAALEGQRRPVPRSIQLASAKNAPGRID